MHPPPFNPAQHRLSDWPDCKVETLCRCGSKVVHPVPLLAAEHGDVPIGPLARSLVCQWCKAVPEQAWLVAGNHRTCVGGPGSLDWAVEIKPPHLGHLG